MEHNSMLNLIALDFDGVVCDSAGETGSTGWRAACTLWPGRFAGEIPAVLLDRFRQVRPILETGFESILLVRLLADGRSVADLLDDAPLLLGQLMHDESLERDALVRLFGRTRDEWMARDLAGWLKIHEFYPGVVRGINACLHPVFIITTKEKRFAEKLLQSAGIRIPNERVFGLESGKKSGVLDELSRQFPAGTIHFVEDRLDTLERLKQPFLRRYLAFWGYNTENERKTAENAAEIRPLHLTDFAEFLREPPG